MAQRFEKLSCVDLSPDNLRFLSECIAREGCSISTYCSTWEDAHLEEHDMVFGYNCFYRLQEPELFLKKVNDSSRMLCVIGMNCPPEFPWLPDMEKAGLSVHYTRQGCAELLEILHDLNIFARFINIPNVRIYRYPDERALIARARQFLMKSCSDEKLLSVLSPHHKKEMNGELVCKYDFNSQLLVWQPAT